MIECMFSLNPDYSTAARRIQISNPQMAMEGMIL